MQDENMNKELEGIEEAADIKAEPIPEVEIIPEPDVDPEEMSIPEPEVAPEEMSIPEPEVAPEEMSIPEPEVAPEEMSIPEPEVAPEEMSIPEPEAAPEEMSIPEPEAAPEVVVATEPEAAPENKTTVPDPFEIVVAPSPIVIPVERDDVADALITKKKKKDKKVKEKKSEKKEKKEKKAKKWLLPVILSVVVLLLAAGVVVAGFMTSWFGLASEKNQESAIKGPLGSLVDAVIATAKADSLSAEAEYSVEYYQEPDSNQNTQGESSIRYYFNEKKKKIVIWAESEEMTTLYDGDKMYLFVDDGVSGIRDVDTSAAFSLISALRGGDEKNWRDFVKAIGLDEYINSKKADKIVALLMDKYLSDEEWLSDNLGFEKNGDEYIFAFESTALLKTLVDIADEAEALEMKAERVSDAIEEKLSEKDVTVVLTVDDGYVTDISIEESTGDETASASVALSDINDTKYDEKEIKSFKQQVEAALEEQNPDDVCAWCGGVENVSLDGDVLVCDDCYENLVIGECDVCNASDTSLRGYEDVYYCLDCYLEMNEEELCCALCGDKEELTLYEGRNFCADCYDIVSDDEYYYAECSSCSAFAEMKYYGGSYYCESCYDDVRYGSDSYDYCDNCEEYASLSEYGNYELCDDCIWEYYICSDCGELTDDYYEESEGVYYCNDCYNEDDYDDREYCELCGKYDEAWYYGGHDFCYDCYSEVKYGDNIYDECEICDVFTVLTNYEGTLYCEDCYSKIDAEEDSGNDSANRPIEGSDSYLYRFTDSEPGTTSEITVYADGSAVKTMVMVSSQSTVGVSDEEVTMAITMIELMFSAFETIDVETSTEGDEMVMKLTFYDLDKEVGVKTIVDIQMFELSDDTVSITLSQLHDCLVDSGFELVE